MEDENVTLNQVFLYMKEMNSNLSSRIDRIEKTNLSLQTTIENEIIDFKLRVSTLEEENKKLVEKAERTEKKLKLNNLIFYGIPEEESTNEDLIRTVRKLLNDKFSININIIEINNLYRLGKKGNQNRPTLVSLTSFLRKQEILRNGKKLKGSGIIVTEDYTEKTLEERKILVPYYKEARLRNKRTILKGSQLIIEGKAFTCQDLQKIETELDIFQSQPQREVLSEPPTPTTNYLSEETDIDVVTNNLEAICSNANEVKAQPPIKEVVTKENTLAFTRASSVSETPKKVVRKQGPITRGIHKK